MKKGFYDDILKNFIETETQPSALKHIQSLIDPVNQRLKDIGEKEVTISKTLQYILHLGYSKK
jgi:hypothetical protein